MPTADRGDTRIVWEEQGSGEPLLLVMGHGWPRQMWSRHLPALARHYRVISFDNRGVGETVTSAQSWTIQDMAADAMAVLDAAGVDRAHVYGASMGGGIAQVIVLDYPERVGSLILGCTAPEASKPKRSAVARAGLRMLKASLSGRESRRVAMARAAAYGPDTDAALILEDWHLMESLNRPPEGVKAQRQAILGYAGSRPRLHEIKSPTLVLHGTHDRAVPISLGRVLADGIPGATMVTFPRAGHVYFTDAPEASESAVLTFLAANPMPAEGPDAAPAGPGGAPGQRG